MRAYRRLREDGRAAGRSQRLRVRLRRGRGARSGSWAATFPLARRRAYYLDVYVSYPPRHPCGRGWGAISLAFSLRTR